MPSRKLSDDTYHDIAHPLNQETRDMFEKAILEEYNKAEDKAEDKTIEDKLPEEN